VRPGEAESRVNKAQSRLRGIAVKGFLGRTVREAGDSIGEIGARAGGIIVDDNGRLRCPACGPTANEFTDAQMSNCGFESLEAVQSLAARVSQIPAKMAKKRRLKEGYRFIRLVPSRGSRTNGETGRCASLFGRAVLSVS